ncbi:MAG: hypothetical protein GY714_31155 [Desulfobacterales bacterium]|nr:hypothetical protein [Desulfobacterales bacterium]
MKIRFKWENRDIPLTPTAITAKGEVSKKFIKKLLTYNNEELSFFKGGAYGDLVFLTFESDINIPWVDGVNYYGYDPETNNLLLPSHSKPSVNAGFIEKALEIKGSTQYIFMKDTKTILSTDQALPLKRDLLIKWIESQ